MNEQGNTPLGGVFRVAYFLALAILLIVFVTTVVPNIYSGPSDNGEVSSFPGSEIVPGTVLPFDQFFSGDEEQLDYDRNLGAVFSLLGAAILAFGIAGLSRAENGLRSGVFVGGVIVHLVGLINASEGSSDWLVSLWSLVGLLTLLWAAQYLENGTNWGSETLARWRGRTSSQASGPPS